MRGTVPVKGTELSYETIGTGDPVVVLGGTALGYSYLRPAMDRLADSFRVVYYDQRGSGDSALGDAERLSFDTAVSDLAALLDGLGLESASLLGHSLGGDTVVLFGARHPDRVDALVVANPGPPFDPEGIEALESEMMSRRTPADNLALAEIQVSEAFQRGEPAGVEAFIRNIYQPFFLDRAKSDVVPYNFSANSAATALDQESVLFQDFDREAAWSSLTNITSPTMVVYAELDPIPESFARALVQAIPSARLEFLSGTGHFAYLETPDLFFPPVMEFLQAEG
ncbi:MAG TPA: alpha/beta hydrolase [Acidimicrobiia bacterium]|jgi:pimeloyl-ACP methyl ester carboxylesterase